ncbi:hypothetical protein BDV33DRAFT_198320 [Aspergillus novoparasiticus]|uniref:chitinase n=1 Tax=Aspergillus novoparasiticus TaxID=986946 RepID=A0A5N6F7U3_9EURO|nr:hypothetical protein BDV33DRAFT_198320 [Aspergillus novoparasiticus]
MAIVVSEMISAYGFCGTTEEFCGTKKVKRPSCDADIVGLKRVIGYYEGWASRRACNDYWPEMIPLNVYSHINFAFASIHPETFEIVPADSRDVNLYTRLTDLKDDDPGLTVNIALGGWSFNDPGSTATTFSSLAASETNQKAFFKSLTSFLATYNFDGVDIDWEYPVDTDRGGSTDDFKNFPKFIANLKSALKGTAGRDHLSLTLPASYWYLQHFDLDELAKHVDYFNFMSYDLHGLWDRGNKWTGAYLDSHTNLTEITNALDLIWRNKVQPSQVVLGLAFYARTFTVDSRSCMDPGCTFASTGNPGDCSATSGILMNSEIDELVDRTDVIEKLDDAAAVEILTWDNQWLTYDDAETFSLKVKFALEECLGGVMVWAISHDTEDGKYASALDTVASRTNKYLGAKVVENGGSEDETLTWTEKTYHPQCKWTGCGEVCPSDYYVVERMDSDKHESHEGCGGACPGDMFEVGSLKDHCHSDGYQAACCKGGGDSLALYRTTEWSRWPECAKGECPWADSSIDEILTASSSGSGAAYCELEYNMFTNDGPLPDHMWASRKICYKKEDKKSLTHCGWYSTEGYIPSGRDEDYCKSSCPDGKIRMAMDGLQTTCWQKGGARSYCCNPDYYEENVVEDEAISKFRTALIRWLQSPVCPASDYMTGLLSRSIDTPLDAFNTIVEDLTIVFRQRSHPQALAREWITVWNEEATKKHPNATMKPALDFLPSWNVYKTDGPRAAVVVFLCNLDYLSTLITDEDKSLPRCGGSLCDYDLDCPPNDDIDNPASDTKGVEESESGNIDARDHLWGKREEREVILTCPGQSPAQQTLRLSPAQFKSTSEWDSENHVYDRAFDFKVIGDCSDPSIEKYSVPTGRWFHTEHIIEIQLMKKFFNATTSGILLSGAQARRYIPVPCHYYTKEKVLRQQLLGGVQPVAVGGEDSAQPELRIMDSLGSTTNSEQFVLLEKDINNMKSRVMVGGTIRDEDKMQDDLDNRIYTTPLIAIRTAIAVFTYLQHETVTERIQRIIHDVGENLDATSGAWQKAYADVDVDLMVAWYEFMEDLFKYIPTPAKTYMKKWLQKISDAVAAQEEDDTYIQFIREICTALGRRVDVVVKLNTDRLVYGYTDAMDVD